MLLHLHQSVFKGCCCECFQFQARLKHENLVGNKWKITSHCVPLSKKRSRSKRRALTASRAARRNSGTTGVKQQDGDDHEGYSLKDGMHQPKFSNPLNGFVGSFRDALKVDELGREISLIAFPAMISLAAEPIASLIDTVFIGQIGPIELAAVGVSISIFNIVSKLFNIPLLNVTTSFVAKDDAVSGKTQSGVNESTEKNKILKVMPNNERLQLPAVSTALVLAAALGIAEAVVLILGAGFFVNVMGVPSGSPMLVPAIRYLALRALGAPGAVVALVAQGAFRGLKDTRTPLYATGIGSIINVALDPIFMFNLGFGVDGAAISTVISEYFIAIVLLLNLNKRICLTSINMGELGFKQYMKSGGLLVGRTIAVLATFSLGTSIAARQGVIPMAAHQICLQLWLSVSLLTDSLALAGQALLADAISKQNHLKARRIVIRVLQVGLVFGLASAMIMSIGIKPLLNLFTSDSTVLQLMYTGVLFVAGTQPINSLAFIFDGLHYGVLDFAYASWSMVVVGAIASFWLCFAPSSLGLVSVWTGLTLFMGLRAVAGFWRLYDVEGPWKFMRQETMDGD